MMKAHSVVCIRRVLTSSMIPALLLFGSTTPLWSQASWQFGTSTISASSGASVGIGTSNPQYKLAVNGTIGATEMVVTTTGWSDYVIQPDFNPKPLSEVAAFINANHRLPDIPSATEVQATGINLGEMQAKLLAKIEELTLHMIKAEERNNRLQEQNRELLKRIEQLEARSRPPK